jgi:hypothetical protein
LPYGKALLNLSKGVAALKVVLIIPDILRPAQWPVSLRNGHVMRCLFRRGVYMGPHSVPFIFSRDHEFVLRSEFLDFSHNPDVPANALGIAAEPAGVALEYDKWHV